MGCPVSFDGFDATWTRGKLSGLSRQGTEIGYEYNAFGQRIRKNISYAMGGVTGYEFCYDTSGRLICESKFSDNGAAIDKLVYLYDENTIIGVVYTANGATNPYFFRRNLLGDVIGIYDTNGVQVAKYKYDAWGNCTTTLGTTNIATRNPIRYRGYYYDTETQLYYLNARYYNPEWRRFISPDSTEYLDPESVNGLNLYCYCNNDPVNYKDPSGNKALPNWLKWIIGGVAFAGAVALTILSGGSLAPVFIGMASSIILGGLVGGISSCLRGEDFWSGFTNGSANGAMWGGLSLLGGAAIRTFNIFKNGVVIGENMTRVSEAAKQLGGVQTYAGKPGFKILKAIKGEAYATTKALAHNKAWLTRMMNWGVKVYDIGIDIERTIGRSMFYEMENALVNSYFNMIPSYLI